jgi:hypothetical protein
MTNKIYEVAGHRFSILGDALCQAIEQIAGFVPFEVEDGEPLFTFAEGRDVPVMQDVLYEFQYEDVTGRFGRISQGFMLTLQPAHEEPLHLWHREGDGEVFLMGNLLTYLFRFALWVGLGLMVAPYNTVALHSSCIVYQNKAVLFLGESGTGKSTHTRLWREHIGGAFLLNDDSPFVRVEKGKVWVYGSPWSGKTPCYKQERYELKGCVRLSQAPCNEIKKLSVLHAYGAIHPSCPPEFAYDASLYDHIGNFIGQLIATVPLYHLACLPNAEAAQLSCQTLFL